MNLMKRSTISLVFSVSCLAFSGVAALAQESKPTPVPDRVAPAPDSPPPAPATDVTAEVKAGTGVEKREVVGESATFPAGTTVWVWSRVTGAEGSVKHVWKRDGKAVWTATLNVGSRKWSTQSRRAIPKAGSWEVEVQTADGASIGTVAFTVQ
jgi:hypothetical protein